MRRILAFLLVCLLLLPSAGLAESTSAAPFTAGEDLFARFEMRPYRANALAAWGNTLAFTDGGRLFVLQDGRPLHARVDALLGHTLEWRDMVTLMGEDGLWVLDQNAGVLWPVDLAEEGLRAGTPQQLDWEDYRYPMPDYVEVYPPSHYALIKGQLFALEGSGQVMVWDPVTGKKQKSGLEGVLWMTPYPAGQLLMLCWQEDTPEGKPLSPMIRIADPAKGTTRDVHPLLSDDQRTQPLRLTAYEPTTDTLYAQLGDLVYTYPGLQEGQAAALPPHDEDGMGLQMVALPGNLLLFAGMRDVYVRLADPQLLRNRVTLKVRVSDNGYRGINQAAGSLPGIDVQITEQGIDQETLAQLMITADDTYDLYWVNLSGLDFERIMTKGYAVDLSASALLTTNHNQLSAPVRRAMGGNDGVFALPVSVYATVFLQEEAFAGAQGKAPVRSLRDLVQFLERWPTEFAQEHPDMLPMYPEDLRRRVFAMVLRAYIDGYIGAGVPLVFDTPLLRELFTRLEGLDWVALGEEKDDEYFAPVLFDNEWMLSLSLMDGDGRDSYTYVPFLPAPEASMEGALPLSVSAVFINPFSQQQPQAMSLIEALVRQVSPDARMMLYHEDSAPVENPMYRQILENQQGRVDQLLFEAEQATGQQKKEIEEAAKRVAYYLEQMKETQRWLISAEQITAWRALSRNAFVVALNGERQGAKAAMEVLMQYADGQLDLDRFIHEVEGRLRLIRQEDR